MLLAASLSAILLGTLNLPTSASAAGSPTRRPPNTSSRPAISWPESLPRSVFRWAAADVNQLTTKSLILPGERLTVPAGGTAPATSRPSGPVAGAMVHTVKSGDFLLGIATMYKVTLADLLSVNKITIKSVISPGRQLALPANAVAPQAVAPAAPAGACCVSNLTYTVKFGDFLAGIASKYKVKLTDLLAVNKLTANSLILPGAKLAMPAGAVEPVATAATAASDQLREGPPGIVVAYAYAQIGKPYRFFTAGPNTFDCSGLVKSCIRPDRDPDDPSRCFAGELRHGGRHLERADQGR